MMLSLNYHLGKRERFGERRPATRAQELGCLNRVSQPQLNWQLTLRTFTNSANCLQMPKRLAHPVHTPSILQKRLRRFLPRRNQDRIKQSTALTLEVMVSINPIVSVLLMSSWINLVATRTDEEGDGATSLEDWPTSVSIRMKAILRIVHQ